MFGLTGLSGAGTGQARLHVDTGLIHRLQGTLARGALWDLPIKIENNGDDLKSPCR